MSFGTCSEVTARILLSLRAISGASALKAQPEPGLDVLINNAGIMEPDKAAGIIDDRVLVSTVTTNLLGPIRLTSALVDQLKRGRGVIVYNTSVLAFVPLALLPPLA